jgi:primosomal protein N' (replication factor Y)
MGNSYISAIKKGVTKGSALISVAEKGYANLFLCSKCRNTASCECGGKLQIQESRKVPQCYICQKNYPEWKCNFCSDNRPFVIAKGIDRTAEEIGKAVPKFPILISSGSKQIKKLPGGNYIVVATPGSEPNERYSTVVMLDGERIFNRPSLRSEELAKFAWFSLLNMVMPDSEVFVSLPNHHPVVQAMLKMDPSSAASYELSSRKQAKLPPYYRVAIVTGDSPEISKFAENLRSSKNSYEITGPIKIESYQSKILIRVELEQAQVLVDLLDDITKVQGVKSRKIFTVRFDPFDL